MTLLFTQKYVGDMCEAIDSMKITAKQKDFARALMRSAIDFANAKNGMHASPGAKAVALSSTDSGAPHD